MNSLRSTTCIALLAVFAAGPAVADNDFGVGIKAGTLGIGLEGTWRPLPYFDVRVGANGYDYDDDGAQAGINYDATLSLETFYATANFHIPLSPFRITAGAFSNGNEFNMVSSDNVNFDVGGDIYTAADVGTLRSAATFADTAPYLGIGFDFTLLDKVGLNLDLGVLWQGEPDVSLTADGLLAADPAFQASLEAERLQLQEDVKDLKAWPVVSLGFVVNF